MDRNEYAYVKYRLIMEIRKNEKRHVPYCERLNRCLGRLDKYFLSSRNKKGEWMTIEELDLFRPPIVAPPRVLLARTPEEDLADYTLFSLLSEFYWLVVEVKTYYHKICKELSGCKVCAEDYDRVASKVKRWGKSHTDTIEQKRAEVLVSNCKIAVLKVFDGSDAPSSVSETDINRLLTSAPVLLDEGAKHGSI